MTYTQAINFHQELLTTAEALSKAATGLKKIAKSLTKVSKIGPNQAWFWTKEWQEGERKADEDIKKGRLAELKDVNDLDRPFS